MAIAFGLRDVRTNRDFCLVQH